MSKQSDSFLPSGGVDFPRKNYSNLSSQTISPLSGIPRSLPMNDFIPSPHLSNRTTPSPKTYMHSPSQQSHGPPLSPPKTRSPSAENASAALVEDWRAYTAKLRSQNEGERAHMAADRARMEEVMAEERALWDHERKILNARIVELEAQLEKTGSATISPSVSFKGPTIPTRQSLTSTGSHPMSVSSSHDGSSSARGVPQESGRLADGSPFYAPAPRNPSRTFDSSETSDMRIDDISAPRESAIRVTSKEFTPSDFVRSPPSTHDLEPIPENLPESIDISHIQPELEGVSIKASAVSPTFAAKVLSPQYSPSKLSPGTSAPPRDVTNLSRGGEEKGKITVEVANEEENRRLTMHAGHTPNHSISTRLPWMDAESGNATPRQEEHGRRPERVHRPSIAPGSEHFHMAEEEDGDGDKELIGQLSLKNEVVKDDPFLAALVERLEEARKSLPASPGTSTESSSSQEREVGRRKEEEDDDKDEGPKLRLKPSFNFGRPMGSM